MTPSAMVPAIIVSDFSMKQSVAANRIPVGNRATLEGERRAVCSRAGVKGQVVNQCKRFEPSETWNDGSIKVTLRLAAMKFCRRTIRLTGSDEYRTAVLRVERRLYTGVRFRDETSLDRILERERDTEDDGR